MLSILFSFRYRLIQWMYETEKLFFPKLLTLLCPNIESIVKNSYFELLRYWDIGRSNERNGPKINCAEVKAD